MFADEKISSWWTHQRVRRALRNYGELLQHAVYEFWAKEDVIDLDAAIERLTPRLRSIADRYWRRDYSQDEIGKEERISRRRAGQLAEAAEEEISEFLCRGLPSASRAHLFNSERG